METFYKAQVENITSSGVQNFDGFSNPFQTVKLKVLDGDLKGQEISVEQGKGYSLDPNQLAKEGETVVLTRSVGQDNQPIFDISDKYRLDRISPLLVIFFILIMVLSGWQGLGSILGMVISLGVVAKFIVPQILAGSDPLMISIVGCLGIMLVTIYLAHGFSKKTTVALISTALTLVATGIIATLFVHLSFLSGLGSEDAVSLKLGPTATINFRGLLLGGILIGALGVLDDVTTGLSAAIFELAKANPKLKFKQLFKSGLVIGREHIASLVNTLVLAYAGVSLPIFITLVLNPNHYPLWTIINSEFIIEEVVRTLAGSIGLIAAVPLTTLLAAFTASYHERRG